jgi:ribosomal protein S18 acetylase RimI-like enzyme/mannose-6-phosphate isomerase-like protein (cupin superfamily)
VNPPDDEHRRASSTARFVENERTGERVEFVHESRELLRMQVTWTQPGHRSVRHAHPGMEERWEVVEGTAAFEVDGVRVEAGPGSCVIAPRGRPHLAWNPTDRPVRLRIEMRPALRWAEFVRRAFAGDDPVELLAEYHREIVLAPPEPAASMSSRPVKPLDVERRPATSDDQALCRTIHHRAYRDVVERQFGGWDDAQQDGYFDAAWRQHGHDILMWGGRPCGYVAIESGPEEVVIHELVVDPDDQNRGIGTHVLLATIDHARRRGRDVTLQVLHENRRAARLYERLGFADDGTAATHRRMRLSAREDDV